MKILIGRISALIAALALLITGLNVVSAAYALPAAITDDGFNASGWTVIDNGYTTGLEPTAGNPDSTFTFSKNEMLEHSFGESGADFQDSTIKFDIYFNDSTDYLGLWWGKGNSGGDGIANALYMGPAGNTDSANGGLAGRFGLTKDLAGPCMYYCGGSDAGSTFAWEDTRWYTVELKIGATSTSYFVDGQLIQTMDMALPSSNTITFGGDDRNGWPFFNGVYVDNISVKPQTQMTAQLNFDSAGGSTVDAQTFTVGKPITTAPTPTRPGYNFTGWKISGSESFVTFPYLPVLSKGMDESVISAGLTDVGDYLNVGDWDANIWYGPDRSDNTLRDVVKYSDGLLYAAIRENLNTLVGDPLLPDGYYLVPLDTETTLTATWVPQSHQVSYSLEGGSSALPPSFEVGTDQTFSVASTPTKRGYKFLGWSDGSSVYAAGATYPKTGAITSDVELTATWTAINTGGAKYQIPGFSAGTSKLTKPMMYKLNAIAKRLTGTKQITCVGYTAGPTVLEIDKYIALNRANIVCNYLAKKNSKLANFKVKIVNTKIVSAGQRKTEITFGK